MSTEIITTLIAFMGILISVSTSVLVNRQQNATEIKKLRTEIQQAYAHRLIEKRIEVYQVLYKLLSEFDKVIHFGIPTKLTKRVISDLFDNILKWDSENAIFMSGNTGRKLYEFRWRLSELKDMSNDQFLNYFNMPKKQKGLLELANQLEVALKVDIGVYIVEFDNENKIPHSYRDVPYNVKENDDA
jgi:hypothetical protein